VYNRKTRHTNALGIVSAWAYDAQGNPTQYVEAQGKPEQRTTHSTYDPYGQLTSRTRGAGDGRGLDAITEKFEYDDTGNVAKVIDGEGHSTSYSYNSLGQVLSQTNALGHTATYTYDAAGNRTSSTNALNETTSYGYDARGRRTWTVSAEGRKQAVVYDSAGRITETIAPGETAGQGTRIGYDQAGNQSQITSPSGLVTKSSYDSQGRITRTEDPAGNVITYEYGAKGNPLAGLLTAVNYPTYKETYQYDQRGRQTAATQHLSADQTRTQRQSYDAMGQRISSTDPAGRTTLYQYDGLGRLIQTIDPLVQHTRQGWNAHDQLVSLTDANGNTHRFEYDRKGNKTKEIRPMGGAILYSYDAIGNINKRTDAGGNTRAYAYDVAARLIQEEYKLNDTTLDQHISYQYNKDGLLTSYVQNDGSGALIGSATYTQDAQGRNVQSAITYGKVSGSGVLSFMLGQSFNQDGQLASHTYPDGSQQTYSYANGQLAKVTLPNGSEISYQDYQWMQPTRIQKRGVVKLQRFDALQRPASIEVKNSAQQILASRQYQYDAAGNITQIQSDLGKAEYGYDALSRLTQASPDNDLQAQGLPQEDYSYDAVGNRLTSAHQPGTWNYNGDNQLVQYPRTTPFNTNPPIATEVSYTPQGQIQKEINSQGEITYSYNAAERLVEVSETGQSAQYRYDPMGQRIAKHVRQGNTTHTIYFLYGEQGLLGETNAQGQLTTAYGFNPNAAQQGMWSTDPIWQANLAIGPAPSLSASTTNYHYLHTDHLGTPMLATAKDGSSSWKVVAEAFGAANVLAGDSEITMNLRFPGQYWDEENNYHHNFQRDYNSALGRYIQGDPIGLDGGVNVFAYVNGNPLSFTDPDGLQATIPGPGGIPLPVVPPTGKPPSKPVDPTEPWGPTYTPNPFKPIKDFINWCTGEDAPPREECKKQCVAEYEVNATSCQVAYVFWKSKGYQACMARAGEQLGRCMRRCDGK
jgi:RHS repeat-associated protein